MQDFRIRNVFVPLSVSVQIQRMNWHKVNDLLQEKVLVSKEEIKPDVLDKLIAAALFQCYMKICKKLEKLGEQGKPMQSLSTIKFSPVEKYALEYIIKEEYQEAMNSDDDHHKGHFFAYFQPILDRFQQFDINNQGLTPTIT